MLSIKMDDLFVSPPHNFIIQHFTPSLPFPCNSHIKVLLWEKIGRILIFHVWQLAAAPNIQFLNINRSCFVRFQEWVFCQSNFADVSARHIFFIQVTHKMRMGLTCLFIFSVLMVLTFWDLYPLKLEKQKRFSFQRNLTAYPLLQL